MRDRLLLKNLVPGKPSTWNRHALTFVYGSRDNSTDIPVELVYPDETLSIGCNAKASKYSYNNYTDNNDAIESISNSTLVVFASKNTDSGHVFRHHKKLNSSIAVFTIYLIILFIISGFTRYDAIGGTESKILNVIMLISHLLCIGFMLSRKEFLLFVHILTSNILLCISSLHIKTIAQLITILIQLSISLLSIDAFKKEIPHVFITRDVHQ